MRQKLILQFVLLLLIAAAIGLAIGGLVAAGLGEILAAGDEVGSKVLKYIALACGGFLIVDLVCLVLILGVKSLIGTNGPDDK